jgi:SOS-response transcriptional repressor LexA
MPRKSEEFGRLLQDAIGELTYREAGRRANLSYTAIGNWAKGEVPSRPDTVRALARALNAPIVPLLEAAGFLSLDRDREEDRERFLHDESFESPTNEEENDPMTTLLSRFGKVRRRSRRPLLGTVPAGPPEHRDPKFKEAREAPYDYDLIVEGDSMEPVIKSGTRVIVMTGIAAKDKDFVVATVNGESTLKQLISVHQNGAKTYTLKALNDGYEEIREGDITIQGVVESVEISARDYAQLQQENEALKRRLKEIERQAGEPDLSF